jgi:hypothetical protein
MLLLALLAAAFGCAAAAGLALYERADAWTRGDPTPRRAMALPVSWAPHR